MHPVVSFDRIGQLGMVLLSQDAVVDQLLVGAVLLELGRAFLERSAAPEGAADLLALADNLLLLDELREEDEERTDGHDAENDEHRPGDDTALLEGLHQAVGVGICGRRGGSGQLDEHSLFPLRTSQ